MSEKLRKVVSESELRVGVIVVVRRCVGCDGGTHRKIILGRTPEEPCIYCNEECPGWRTSPDECGDPELPDCLRLALRDGRLYRVIDGLDADADAREMRRVESEAANVAAGRVPAGE